MDSGFQSLVGFQILELYSGFQSPRFRILQAKFPPILESGFPYMGRTVCITRGRGGGGDGTPDFKWGGWSNGGQKLNPPKKSLGLTTKPKKIPGPNINPRRILCQISRASLVVLYSENYATTNLQIVLNTPKKSLLKSIHPKKILAKFSYPNKSRNQKFRTQKLAIIYHSLRLKLPLRIFLFFSFLLHDNFFLDFTS